MRTVQLAAQSAVVQPVQVAIMCPAPHVHPAPLQYLIA
jgi:hypothetical protein